MKIFIKRDSLFKLIHSLNPSEKGYFKKFAKRHYGKGSEYEQLFDAILKMNMPDDAALKKKFKRLSDTKNYLFQQLLNALTEYYSSKENTRIYLSNLFSHAAVLEKKGLVDEALRTLDYGAETAEFIGDVFIQYIFETVAHSLKIASKSDLFHIDEIHHSLIKLLNLLESEKRILQYKFEDYKMGYISMSNEYIVNDKNADLYVINTDFLLHPLPPLSESEERAHKIVLLTYLQYTNNNNRVIEILEKDLKQVNIKNDKDYKYYSQLLTKIIYSFIKLHNIKKAEKYLEQLYTLKTSNKMLSNLNKDYYWAAKLALYVQENKYPEAAAIYYQAITDRPELINHKKPELLYGTFLSNSLLALFNDKKYNDCAQLLNNANIIYLRNKFLLLYRDIEIMRLMLQIEIKNADIIPFLLRSITEKFKKHKLFDEYEKLLLKFFDQYYKGMKHSHGTKIIASLLNIYKSEHFDKNRALFMGMTPYHEYIKKYLSK